MERLQRYCASVWPNTHMLLKFKTDGRRLYMRELGEWFRVDETMRGYEAEHVRGMDFGDVPLERSGHMININWLEKHYEYWRPIGAGQKNTGKMPRIIQDITPRQQKRLEKFLAKIEANQTD